MALDEPKGDDKVLTDDGITYVINEGLFNEIQPIKVDYVNSAMGTGFDISGNMPLSSGSACGSTCSC